MHVTCLVASSGLDMLSSPLLATKHIHAVCVRWQHMDTMFSRFLLPFCPPRTFKSIVSNPLHGGEKTVACFCCDKLPKLTSRRQVAWPHLTRRQLINRAIGSLSDVISYHNSQSVIRGEFCILRILLRLHGAINNRQPQHCTSLT
jgi:hypothetical protein